MRKITHNEYLNRLDGIGATVRPTEQYILSSIPIEHICLNCNAKKKFAPNKVIEYTKKGLYICQECSGKKLFVGKNDLWTTNPEVAKMLKNPNEGYEVTRCSDKKLDWVCKDCGCIIKQKTVYNTVTNGLVCPLCGNTRSLGHRLVNSVLNELNIDYENEKSFYWSDGRFYDIYIENINCIIEVNGIQHYEEKGFNNIGGHTLKQEIENDNYKKHLAFINGIKKYIYIDARKSDIDFIINSIKNNDEFNILFDLTNVNWSIVVSNALTSEIIQIKELYNQEENVSSIAKKLHLSETVVTRKLHSLTQYGLCDYKGIEEVYKPVVCLNTKEEFINLQEAGKTYGIDPNGISFCCRGLRNRSTAGKLKDGTKLTWLFKDDYELKTEEEIQEIINKSITKPYGTKKIVCLNTKEIFDSIKQGQLKYSDAKSISDCCRHIAKASGVHPITKEKLMWRYYDEYINLSEEEIKNILDDKYYDDKRVICLNTLEVFDNAVIAGKWCGVKRSGILACTSGRNNTNGYHPKTNEPLRWMKYRDYLESTTSQEVSA